MGTFVLKRKTFSEDKKGVSTSKKLALGAAGTLGAAGLAFAGARRGMLGQSLKLKSNNLLNSVGSKVGGSIGSKMQGMANKQLSSGKNLNGVTLNSGGTLNSASQRAANSGTKLDVSSSQAKEQLSKGTGINSVSRNKPLTELEYERAMAFSEHQ